MSENKKYYVPPTVEEKKSGMEMAGVPNVMKEMADSSGMIHVQLERDVTIEKIARDLYKDPKAGIREYVNNEARPCRAAIKRGHEATIYVTIDKTARTITIEGRGSMGMTMQTFKDVYTVLGRSGNFDGDESGQFGFGRASYLCLSDIVVFETRSRETGERFGFLGKGGKVYEPIPDHLLSIREYGTKVTMTVREGINMYDLVEYTKHISKFLEAPVFLELPTPISKYDYGGGENPEDVQESGVTQIGPVSIQDFLMDRLGCEDGKHQFLEIDNDDYRLVGIIGSGWKKFGLTCLIGIPIEMDNFPFSSFNGYVLNIKNERKYMPTASRDSLSAESASRIGLKIKNDLQRYFSTIHVNTINDYLKSDSKIFIKSADRINGWGFRYNVLEFSSLLRESFIVANANGTARDSEGYTKRECLYDILETGKNVYYLRTLNKDKIKTFMKVEPNSAIITPFGSKANKNEHIQLLRRFEIPNLTEYIKSKKIKIVKNPDTEITVHFGGFKKTRENRRIGDLNKDCIKLPASVPLHESLDNMRNDSFRNLVFVKDSKALADAGSVTLEEFCKNAERAKYETSDGVLTGRQILKKYESGIVGLVRSESKFPEILTVQKCKKLLDANIVIEQKCAKDSMTPNIARLKLACKVRHPERDVWTGYGDKENTNFRIAGSSLDGVIRDELTESKLGIKVGGKWKDDPDKAVERLGQIKSIPVRELYANAYNAASRWDRGWNSTDKNDKKTMKELHEEFLRIDKTAGRKSLIPICRGLINFGVETDTGYYKTKLNDIIAQTAFDCVVDSCKTAKSEQSRLARTLNAVMKGVTTGRIGVKIERGDKRHFKISMAVQPIDLREDCLLFRIVNAATYHSCFNIISLKITDDNMMEIGL